MKIWYADTSALIKRYVREKGSDWFRTEVIRNQVIISQLTPIELTAALGRRFRQGAISKFAYYQAHRMFLLHLRDGKYQIVDLDQRIVDEAMRLTFRQGLRAYDAVQLATAIVEARLHDRSRFIFLTSDAALEAVSMAVGLNTGNPLKH